VAPPKKKRGRRIPAWAIPYKRLTQIIMKAYDGGDFCSLFQAFLPSFLLNPAYEVALYILTGGCGVSNGKVSEGELKRKSPPPSPRSGFKKWILTGSLTLSSF